MTKICYASVNFGIHDERFLTKMIEYKYEVHAISFRRKKLKNEEKIKGIIYHEFCNAIFNYRLLRKLKIFWYIGACLYLKKKLNKLQPDILHAVYVTIAGLISASTNFHPFLLMPWGSDILLEPKQSYLKRND